MLTRCKNKYECTMDQELALGAQTLLHVAAATSDGWA